MNDKIKIEIDKFDAEEFSFFIREHYKQIGHSISYGDNDEYFKEFFEDILEQIERQMS